MMFNASKCVIFYQIAALFMFGSKMPHDDRRWLA